MLNEALLKMCKELDVDWALAVVPGAGDVLHVMMACSNEPALREYVRTVSDAVAEALGTIECITAGVKEVER